MAYFIGILSAPIFYLFLQIYAIVKENILPCEPGPSCPAHAEATP